MAQSSLRSDLVDYFYCPPEKIAGDEGIIDGEEFSHLVHVMRKKEGDSIRIVNGVGMAYDARITEVKKHAATIALTKSYNRHHESLHDVAVAVGVLKNPSKFDFIVEKVTELGVNRIIPLQTERTIPDHAKTERWQKLALAAMKQSRRSCLPIVDSLTTLSDLLRKAAPAYEHRIVAHEQPVPTLRQASTLVEHQQRSIFLVGPEGGLSDEELAECFGAGFLPLFLGERRLRTETAAIVCATLAMR